MQDDPIKMTDKAGERSSPRGVACEIGGTEMAPYQVGNAKSRNHASRVENVVIASMALVSAVELAILFHLRHKLLCIPHSWFCDSEAGTCWGHHEQFIIRIRAPIHDPCTIEL
ncbi:hypothetical protein BDV06DRAFT_192781 [Aspergillus oleicola]